MRAVLAHTVLACSCPSTSIHGMLPELWPTLALSGVPCPRGPRLTHEGCYPAVVPWDLPPSDGDGALPAVEAQLQRSMVGALHGSAAAMTALHGGTDGLPDRLRSKGLDLDGMDLRPAGQDTGSNAGSFGAVYPGRMLAHNGETGTPDKQSMYPCKIVLKVSPHGGGRFIPCSLAAGLLAAERWPGTTTAASAVQALLLTP